MSLESESLLAAIGLERVLRGNPAFGQGQQDDVVALPDRIRRSILRFMGGGDAEVQDEPDFDYDAVDEMLHADDTTNGDRIAALRALGLGELTEDVIADATRITQLLTASFPRRSRLTSVKVTKEPPEPFALARFERQWAAARDPLGVVRDLESGAIDTAEVAALEAMWSELYALVLGIADQCIATMKVRRGENWDLDDEKDRAFKTLLGVPTIDLDLAKDYAQYAQPVYQPPPKGPAQKASSVTGERLPGQQDLGS